MGKNYWQKKEKSAIIKFMFKTIRYQHHRHREPDRADRRNPNISSIFLLLFTVLAFSTMLLSCDLFKEKRLTLKPGILTVLTRNIPTVYYQGPEGETGFEYDLVLSLARELGLKLEIKVAASISDMLAQMAADNADIAAGALTRTRERERRFTFGPDYYTVRQQLVYRKGSRHPHKVSELQGFPLLIPSRSSYVEQLQELKQQYPELEWQTTDRLSSDQLLEKVWLKKIPCTIVDSNILALNRRYYPELKAAFPISKEQPLAWIINPKLKKLRKKLSLWLNKIKKNGQFKQLEKRYYYTGDVNFDYVDIKVFIRRIETRLPQFRELFDKYGRQYHIPWTLLAAKAYQESHWNPEATSITGVRGIMMLTNTTARQLGISDRLDPEESIRGGAKYLRQLLDRVPESYPETDRLNVAMAAYNVGMGHIYDARRLARELGLNPDRWSTLEKVLPLLKQKKYYATLKYGYARGREPVRYVSQTNNYRNILEKKVGLLDGNRAIGAISAGRQPAEMNRPVQQHGQRGIKGNQEKINNQHQNKG
jgi:membrane-bound lytic murein transglycosylase F